MTRELPISRTGRVLRDMRPYWFVAGAVLLIFHGVGAALPYAIAGLASTNTAHRIGTRNWRGFQEWSPAVSGGLRRLGRLYDSLGLLPCAIGIGALALLGLLGGIATVAATAGTFVLLPPALAGINEKLTPRLDALAVRIAERRALREGKGIDKAAGPEMNVELPGPFQPAAAEPPQVVAGKQVSGPRPVAQAATRRSALTLTVAGRAPGRDGVSL